MYADVLHYITVCFVFSAAIPHMMVLGTAGLFLKYWVYKYCLLRYNKRPPVLDYQIISLTYGLIPFTIVLHLAMTIWELGYQPIFPIDSSPFYKQLTSLIASTGGTVLLSVFSNAALNDLFTRALFNIYFTGVLAIILLYYLLKLLLVNGLGLFVKILCGAKEEEIDPSAKGMQFDKVVDAIDSKMLTTYDIKKNA